MKLYRVESQRLKSSEIFYLVKDIRVKDKTAKVRKRIGKMRPSEEVLEKLTSTPDIDIEREALSKKISMSSGLYRSRYLQLQGLPYLEKTKYRDDFFSLFLTVGEEKYFEEKYEAEYVQGTTSIEGNTFTVQQVDELLQRGNPPSRKSLREINEVQNYLKVKECRDSYRGKVTIPFILKLHDLIMDNIDVESAGRFRRIDEIGIKGLDIAVTPAIEIENELQAIIDEYYSNIKAGWHPFEEAVLFHYKFEMIHPFTDGNGRVGREILNYMLTKAKYPRLIITKTDREKYISALQYGNQGLFVLMVSTFVSLLQDKRADLFESFLGLKVCV